MAKDFQEIEKRALADPSRRGNIERERAILLASICPEVRVLHEPDQETWRATSSDIPGWTIVADNFEEARRLAEEGAPFGLDRDDVEVKHFVLAASA